MIFVFQFLLWGGNFRLLKNLSFKLLKKFLYVYLKCFRFLASGECFRLLKNHSSKVFQNFLFILSKYFHFLQLENSFHFLKVRFIIFYLNSPNFCAKFLSIIINPINERANFNYIMSIQILYFCNFKSRAVPSHEIKFFHCNF